MTHGTRRRFLLGTLATTALAGCGFQLRGAQGMPFQSIYLGTGEYSELTAALRRQLEAGGAQVVDSPTGAQVRLQVIRDTQSKTISSLSSAAQVREYTLFRYFDFRLVDTSGAEIIPAARITIRRTLTYNENDLLAKEGEEQLLYKDMGSDLVRQVLRRLAAAKLPATAKS